jgi:hypothetical protein
MEDEMVKKKRRYILAPSRKDARERMFLLSEHLVQVFG